MAAMNAVEIAKRKHGTPGRPRHHGEVTKNVHARAGVSHARRAGRNASGGQEGSALLDLPLGPYGPRPQFFGLGVRGADRA